MHLFARSPFRIQAAQAILGLMLLFLSIPAAELAAQTSVVTQSQPTVSGYVCPKCGRVHASRPATAAVATVARPIAQVSHQAVSTVGGGVQNVLSMLNGQRSRQGLRSLRYDASLQAVAERRARQMASSGRKSHPPGSFAPGRYEGVGWSSSFSPRGVYACYTSDPNMTAAGAAMVPGRDGVYFAVVYR